MDKPTTKKVALEIEFCEKWPMQVAFVPMALYKDHIKTFITSFTDFNLNSCSV